ncbi:MAG: alpha/beta hydrolase [Polyangiaceae bacterium]
MSAPFVRGPFAELPDRPRLAHGYDDTMARELVMDSVPFGKIRVHYREHGEGPPLLLVHGLMTTSYSWRYVFAELGKRYRVIAPDLPGAGATDKPLDREYSIEALATWVGEFQRALGIRGTRTVGNSLGGLICMRLALDDAEAFSRLVNIHSPLFPEARHAVLHGALLVPGVKSLLARVIRMNPHRWVHRNVHYHDETLKSLEEARAYGDPLDAPGGAEAFIRYLSDAISTRSFSKIAHTLEERHRAGTKFPVPLLLIYARKDPMVRPENGARLAKLIDDAKFVWLEESSHFPHVDSPERLLEEVLEFLD